MEFVIDKAKVAGFCAAMNQYLFGQFAFIQFNFGLTLGLMILALLAMRPLLVRILSPGQRVAVWTLVWFFFYCPSFYRMSNVFSVLPVTFRSLVTPRVGRNAAPAYLPNYVGEGLYNIVLPGGGVFEVEIPGWFPVVLLWVWVAGMVLVCWYDCYSSKKLLKVASQGEEIPSDSPLRRKLGSLWRDDVLVRQCKGLPTSFVYRGRESKARKCRYAIYLQEGLSSEQLRLVLLHEGMHIQKWHCVYKFVASIALAVHWWNPVIWLGYHVFCRDLELACDRAVLERLDERDRRSYARALVELGSGRQLWEAPLSFGECDAEQRVKAAAVWRPAGEVRKACSWVAVVLVFLFLMGGPVDRIVPQDILTDYARETGDSVNFARDVEEYLREELKSPEFRAEEIWYWEEPSKTWLSWSETQQRYLWVQDGQGDWCMLKLFELGWARDVYFQNWIANQPDLTDGFLLYRVAPPSP